MSLAMVCPCGRKYSAPESLAGKKIRCKQCGQTLRVPNPDGPAADAEPVLDLDLYDRSDEPPPEPAPLLVRATRPAAATARRAAEPEPPATGPAGKARKTKAERLREAIPGRDDAAFLVVGVVGFVLTAIAAASGSNAGALLGLFLIVATPACLLWAGVAALRASYLRENGTLPSLLGAIAASLLGLGAFLGWVVIGRGMTAVLVLAAAALAGYARFVSKEKRFQDYRRPVALAACGTLLFLSTSIMANVAGNFLAAKGLSAKPLPQAVAASGSTAGFPLADARRAFKTRLTRRAKGHEPVPDPPPELFETVQYPSAVGPLWAYMTPPADDGARRPAILWITGGDSSTIGDVWSPSDPANDQTAAAFRKAGFVMMFPSLRGGNDNPGAKEGFLGEVDDVLAAAKFLSQQEHVDPKRIYLGGHSTGGTLVMLAAASTDRFRAVFAFGPVHDVSGYGEEYCPFNLNDPKEVEVRSPGRWLNAVRCPTYVFEGVSGGNVISLWAMQRSTTNPLLHFHAVPGADHFSILAPTTQSLAAKLLQDTGPTLNLTLGDAELARPFAH